MSRRTSRRRLGRVGMFSSSWRMSRAPNRCKTSWTRRRRPLGQWISSLTMLMKNVDQDSWERMIEINCKGILNGVAAVLPGMLARKSGHIVNISSDAGRKVFAGLGVYSATKMFIEGISQALRLENCGSGLRVTSIQPGDVTTSLVDHANAVSGVDEEATKMFNDEPECEELQSEDVSRAVLYAVMQPPHVAVNEVLVQPRDRSV
ncbi:hypothetical protein, variant 1 [Phytophthora nicotianae]|uniref:NADP-dependent 3-hydroxy acid dehydrogenase YdfG n=1 Tax=Phytophthora nicotianae TaxID=4792 RepID=W2G280_PHYNI|nr:hypothetical protein, variant 1 [Phytophthora nicotianae]ETL30559.1 hypothetical protein, variant 1 [Phytophthora nicotianae]